MHQLRQFAQVLLHIQDRDLDVSTECIEELYVLGGKLLVVMTVRDLYTGEWRSVVVNHWDTEQLLCLETGLSVDILIEARVVVTATGRRRENRADSGEKARSPVLDVDDFVAND